MAGHVGFGDVDEGEAGGGEDRIFVGGEGAVGGDLFVEGAGGPFDGFGGGVDFLEGEAVVAEDVVVEFFGMLIEIVDDGGEGEVFFVDFAFLGELVAEADVGLAVGAGVADVEGFVGGVEDDFGGALDLDHEGFDGFFEPEEFEAMEAVGLHEFAAGGVGGAEDFSGDGVGVEVRGWE